MKIIKYQTLNRYNVGTVENPNWKEGFGECIMGYNEANLKMAEQEAYNGVYTIEEIPDVVRETADDVLNAMLGVE